MPRSLKMKTIRLKQLIEDGWTVDFSYNNTQTLPNKLLLKQALQEDQRKPYYNGDSEQIVFHSTFWDILKTYFQIGCITMEKATIFKIIAN